MTERIEVKQALEGAQTLAGHAIRFELPSKAVSEEPLELRILRCVLN
jgi:hypothetical protein